MVFFPQKQGTDQSTVFNMGVSTLIGINSILEELAALALIYENNLVASQTTKIRLVKELLKRSAPLLGDDLDKFRSRILSLTPATTTNPHVSSTRNEIKVYSRELELLLDNLIIDIQLALQSKHVFMPSKADPKHGWKQ